MAERQFGPYRLVRQIAVGGMAEIHLAKATGLAGFEKYVAIKMIHPNFAEDDQFIQMLVDEAKIAVQLTHGNIAQTFDLGRVGETYYITMEYVDGADLYKILRRASEQDLEMPLDVCAFVGKEISSALDHAHRKRDHTGKSLGIVHRDVSPQNVLVSYSGEVKLVDFGIAKATMKVRQTAVGVIKGKYYYMSPEQAWGDPIDHRSDIFSAGIVLYEMITGQMLYLEEDLHKLLEMARSADIAPPSQLRRGVPPQLERIVMHALEKVPGERYQSAGDFATDLERFLHAYSPVFTASKLSTLLRQVVGDPMQVPDDPGFARIEFRDGVMSTHPLDDAEVAHAIDRAELRDENSVIFKVAELGKSRPSTSRPSTSRPGTSRPGTPRPGTPRPGTPRPTSPRSSTPPPLPSGPASRPTPQPIAVPKQSAPRITRPADPLPLPARPAGTGKLPSITAQRVAVTPRSGQVMKPREAHEDTRRLESPAPVDPLHDDSSGLLMPDGNEHAWDDGDRLDTSDDDLENIGERTLITGAPMGGFMMDVAGDDQVEATVVTSAPTGFGDDESTIPRHDDGPTLTREPTFDPPRRSKSKAQPPAALSARIHAPAVSEIRKPRPSRRTPSGGVATQAPSVLHAIVASQASEPMPAPRRSMPASPPPQPMQAMPAPHPAPPQLSWMAQSGAALSPAAPQPPTLSPAQQPLPPTLSPGPSSASTLVPGAQLQPPHLPAALHTTLPDDAYAQPFPVGAAGMQAPYSNDASGLPMTVPTPPGMSAPPVPGVPPHLQPYLHMQGMPPGYSPPQLATQTSPHGYPQLSPGALYQFQPPVREMSLTGQMRLFEVDELPSQYKLGASRRRWFTYIVSGALAVLVAAAVTFLIIRSIRETTPRVASAHIRSIPDDAAIYFDGTLLANKTPVSIPDVKPGSEHEIRIVRTGYQPFETKFVMPKDGTEYELLAQLKARVGRLLVDSLPPNAEIFIDGKPFGRTPKQIPDVDIDSINRVELRLKDYQPVVKAKKDLEWSPDGKAVINETLVR